MNTKKSWLLACLPAVSLALVTGTALAAAAVTTTKIDFDQGAVKPTHAQATAIQRATRNEIGDCLRKSKQACYALVPADLNDDGHPDLLVQFSGASGFCGSRGCSGAIVMATRDGYSRKSIDLPNFYGEIDVLPSRHRGMHDLHYGGYNPIWEWNGRQYDVDKAARSLPVGPPWQTRQADGRTLAMVQPSGSPIKVLSLFCNKGKPVLAMVLARPPKHAITLTWVLQGGAVDVPMGRGNRNATLWLADLSQSPLPGQLSRLGKKIYLLINGGLQGVVSMHDAKATTQSALKNCYHEP